MDSNIGVMEEPIKRESTDRFPCPSCGANIKFDPGSQSLVCPYCDSKIEVMQSGEEIKEYCFLSAIENQSTDWGSEKRVIHCDSCGANTILDDNVTSQCCPFCGSSHIVKDIERAGIAPESLVPFKIAKNKAMEGFTRWISRKFFAPRALKKEYHAKNITGAYIPFWTYDSHTHSSYRGEGGTYYYVNETRWVTRNGKRQQVTERVRKTRWWPTSGNYSEFFDDVLINASEHVDKKLIEQVQPFNLKELVHYKPEFLSGFIAEKYSIDLKSGWLKAKSCIDDDIRSGVIRKINADEVRNLSISTNYDNIKYKHILLPVWLSSYTYKGKVYQFMINGQTGEVQGQAPVSPLKIAGAIVVGLGVAWALVQILSYFAQTM